MRKLLFLALVVVAGALARPVAAQETWTLNPTATEVITADFGRIASNSKNCARLGLASGDIDANNCTQAQACSAAPACPGGSGCSTTQALACDVTSDYPQGRRIFPNSVTGREQYVGVVGVRALLNSVVSTQTAQPPVGSSFEAYCQNFWAGATQATRDSECSKSGQPAKCPICPQ